MAHILLIILSYLACIHCLANEQAAAGKMVRVMPEDKTLLPYLLYLPQDYSPEKKFPMLLFLHGTGSRGNNLNKLFRTGIPPLIQSGKHFPFIIVMPQCPDDGHYMSPASNQFWHKEGPIIKAKNILDREIKLRSVDKDRIYVTGLSLGGIGTYHMINKFPKFFAAAAPICGFLFEENTSDTMASDLKGFPIWAFHGDKDRVISLANHQKTVDKLKSAGVDIKLTVYPGVRHDSWTRTYNNPRLYEWFLSHKRNAAE